MNDTKLIRSVYHLSNADRTIGGTATILRSRDRLYLLTARHCVDAKYREPDRQSVLPSKLMLFGEIFLDDSNTVFKSFEVLISDWLFDPNDHDVALAVIKGFETQPNYCWTLSVARISDATRQLDVDIRLAGYPNDTQDDVGNPVRLVRQGILASSLSVDVNVPNAIGKRYGLVDSFSVSGLSGGPVFGAVPYHINLSGMIRSMIPGIKTNSAYDHVDVGTSRKSFWIIGVNCGHFRSKIDRMEGQHAGLSYFAKAEVLESILKVALGVEKLPLGVTPEDESSPVRNDY